jgi:hypothetical protein
MGVGIFTDKNHQPTLDEVMEAIGQKQAEWQEIVQFIREKRSVHEEFRYYGKNYGWALRFRKSSKSLTSLYPAEGGFTIQIILNETEVEKALSLGLGEHIEHIMKEAHPFPEGRWLFIPVESDKDLQDIKVLLSIKTEVGKQGKSI